MFLAVSSTAFSQLNVDGVEIGSLDIKFVEIVAAAKFMSQKVTVQVDYGQKYKMGQLQKIKGIDGKNKVFMSVVDALNYMDKNGWDFVTNYVVTEQNQNVYHYLFKKKEV